MPLPPKAKMQPNNSTESGLSKVHRCWNWAKSTHLAKWGFPLFLKPLRMGLTCSSAVKRARSNNEKELSRLSGSPHLVKLLQVVSHPLAKMVQELLVSAGADDCITAFLQGELPAINSLMDVMLPAMGANLVRHVHESIYEETGEYPVSVTILDIICCLHDLVKNHLPHIVERIQRLEGKTDSTKRENKIMQLFIPLTDELLAILLPGGENDLPLLQLPLVAGFTWSLLRNSIIPGALMAAYQRLTQPFNLDDKQALLAMPGGGAFVSMAETAAQQPGELIPSFFVAGSPALEAIREAVKDLCRGVPSMKQWLSNWVAAQAEGIAHSGRNEVSSIFELCGSYIEPLLLHVFRHLASVPVAPQDAQGRLPDAIGMASIKLFAVISAFMNTHQPAISARMAALTNASAEIDQDEELLRVFGLLADDLMQVMGLGDPNAWPVPDFLRTTIAAQVKAAAPKFLVQQYLAIANGSILDEESRKKLRSFFFDEKQLQNPVIGTNVITFLHRQGSSCAASMFDDFYQKLWEESGTDRVVRTLEGMSAVLAGDFVDSMMARLGVSSQTALQCDRNPFMQQATAYLKTFAETVVLRILTHFVSTTPDDVPAGPEEHPRKYLAVNALLRLIDTLHKGMKHIDEKLNELDQLHAADPDTLWLEKRKVFGRLAEDLHKISGDNPLSHLPFEGLPGADALKELLWDAVKTIILPDVLAVQYDDIAGWDRQLQASLDALEECYHTSHPQWACKVLAQYGTDFIRHYLATGGDESAKLLLDAMLAYFAASSAPAGQGMQGLLEEQAEELRLLLGKNLATAGDYQDAPMLDVWPLLTRYLEGIIAKFLAGFSSTVKEIEANNPDFMLDVAISMLKDTADYFSIVNTIVQQYDEEHAYNIDPMAVITGFGGHLHPGVPVNPAAPESEKDRIRLEGCFIPRAMNLLDLANISIKDFPLPAGMRQPLGELVVGTVLPLALLRADQNALSHHVRDALMLNFVQTLYTALNGVEPLNAEEVLEESKPAADPKQKKLNETCGSVVLELVKLIPDTMVQYVFMKEKVQNMSAEAIGEAIMPHLSRWTLLQLIDTLIYVGLPSLHPSKWEGKSGREVLIPRKAFIKPNGKMALKPVRKFKFTFPRTDLDMREEQLRQIENAKKTRLMLRDGFTLIISSQLRAKLWVAVKSIWADFQGQLDAIIERQFPERGREMKVFLDGLFRRFFFDLVGTVVQFLSIPLVNGVERIVQKVYIDAKSKDIIENLHSDALENLVYKWMDTLLDTLIKLREQDKQKSKASALKAVDAS